MSNFTKLNGDTEKWYDDFNWGGIIMIIFVVVGLVTMLNLDYIFPEQMAKIDEINKEMAEEKKLNRIILNEHDDIARDSIDCKELQKTQLHLIGKGANADAWIPSIGDKALKIANERSEIICFQMLTESKD